MKIILLGTGTTLPNINRNASGLLIQIDRDFLLFDCGNGILRQLEKANIDFIQIKQIFISHIHLDHVNDLPALLKANLMRQNPYKIKIYGPSTIRQTVEGWFSAVYPYLNAVLSQIEVQEIKGGWVTNKNWRVQGFPVEHGIEAYGFKLEADGKTLVYSGDTAFCEELIQAAKNADLLIHECSYPSDLGSTKGHTNPLELGKIAQQASVGQVVLTHFYPICEGREQDIITDVKKNYKGKVVLGTDLLTIELV